MSISGSLYTASTALNTYGLSMSVVGHNIANLNTVGFKASRMEFADLLPNTQGEIEAGRGVRMAGVSNLFRQGTLETTGNLTDLAITGAGFFTLRDTGGNTFYTRAGQFHIDSDAALVNPLGLKLQGSSGNIVLGSGVTLPAQPTASVSLVLNLDATSSTPATNFPAGLDASAASWFSASNFSAVVPLFDSSGQIRDVTLLFRRSAPNSWDYTAVARTSELDPLLPTSTDLRRVSPGGTLVFTPGGDLDLSQSTINGIDPLNWVGGGAGQSTGALVPQFTGSVQFAQPSALLSLRADGSSTGILSGLFIDSLGTITGRFSNGGTMFIDRIALATFANVDGLGAIGDSLFASTDQSGAALTGFPGEGGMGAIVSGALEMSTVDLAQEFVSLITSQRGFQMSSRVITVADQMYAEAANLKR